MEQPKPTTPAAKVSQSQFSVKIPGQFSVQLNTARFLNRTSSMGLVAEGYNADLVLLDTNPLESSGALKKIFGVVRAGFFYSAADLQLLRDRVAKTRGVLR